jgi:hypothetical protein
MSRTILQGSITRRSLLRGGTACALASVVPYKLFGETTFQNACRPTPSWRSAVPLQTELYVFRGSIQGRTAIAVTWPEHTKQDCTVRFHAGTRTWEFSVPARGVSQSRRDSDFTVFIGNVAAPGKADDTVMKAVVVEVDAHGSGLNGSSIIWAERMMRGSRQRIGTPFLSAIARDHGDLAHLYHASSPDQDATVLLQPLSAAIAERLRLTGSAANPDAHARRLASSLLPDVLHYDPRRPAGFTFAARNGRHPSESSDAVVHTILNGGKASESVPASPYPSVQAFPYFEQTAAV